METVIQIDEAIVNDIQAKDVDANISQSVILKILDMHEVDEDASFMNSPVFKAYQEEAIKKHIIFEKAKAKLSEENIPADIKPHIKEWSLNYYTNELTVIS